ncbi:MAG: histidine--tRNA ligase [Gammaproteobacteria bacterium]|nr:histidine--tRNA ligase [Gammaproteobacteria bacterium]
MDKIHSLTGMIDLVGQKTDKIQIANRIFFTEKILRSIFKNYSLLEIRTPALEDESLFKRSVGDSSDIVNKELYSFLDKNEKRIVLRPEGTAGVIRSIIEKKTDGDTHKLWYLGPMWRYERPQKGRFRQFYQAGVEILGYKEGIAELEMISLICSINKALDVKNPVVKINHLGNKDCKKRFCNDLVDYLKPMSADLEKKDLERLTKNPLRILDSKSSETQNILKDAPVIVDYLPQESKDLLELIKDMFSDECNIKIDYKLVRGLDYYTGFVFEAISQELGAQDAYLGGGRYDELCSQLGGKHLPAIGMAIGIERLASLVNKLENNKTLISFIILSSKIEQKAYKIAQNLRLLNNKINLDIQLSEGSLKSKLRRASKDNASYALIIGEEELKSDTVVVKPLLDKNSEQSSMNLNELYDFIKSLT